MRIKWKKIFFRLLGFELLAVELIELLARGLRGFKAEMRRRLITWAIKVAIVLLLLGLAHCALLFGLGAMALYLNDLLGSSYQGFLIVSGGCVALLLLLWLLRHVVRWLRGNR
jgi:hypothetical protein